MMKLLLALTFLWTLWSSAGALQCLSCTNPADPTCGSNTSVLCATAECLTATAAGPTIIRSCGSSSVCPNPGNQMFSVNSTNYGFFLNASCCNTDNCNTATLSAPTFQSGNSLRCYSCDNINLNCSVQLQCQGGQNRCFNTSATSGSVTFPVRGCVSSNLCTAAPDLSSLLPFSGFSSITCCQGSLCNSAPAVATTAHLLLALLLFSLYH